jgi:hypothetical protein
MARPTIAGVASFVRLVEDTISSPRQQAPIASTLGMAWTVALQLILHASARMMLSEFSYERYRIGILEPRLRLQDGQFGYKTGVIRLTLSAE